MTINQFEKDRSLLVRNSIGNHENGKTKKNQQNVAINFTPKTTLLTTMEIATMEIATMEITTMEITTMVHNKENRIERTTILPADQNENDDEEEEEEREDE